MKSPPAEVDGGLLCTYYVLTMYFLKDSAHLGTAHIAFLEWSPVRFMSQPGAAQAQ